MGGVGETSRNLPRRLSIPERLKTDLIVAMRDRDSLRVRTIRSLISAVDNAGAVPVDSDRYEPKIGLGHDVPRRQVTDEEIREMLGHERDDLLQAASEYRTHGQNERAGELEIRAGIVSGYLE